MRAFAKLPIFAACVALAACEDDPVVVSLDGGPRQDAPSDAPAPDAAADAAADAATLASRVLPGYLATLDAPIELVADGDGVPVAWAPQGGYFMFLTARFGPHDGSDIELSSRLIDPDSGSVLREDVRQGPVILLANEPGMYEPDPDVRAAVSHIATCPPSDDVQLLGRKLRLEMRVRGGSFDMATELSIVPSCAGATPGEQQLCECYCSPSYEPGGC